MDDISDIKELYDNNPQYEDERLDRHQLEHDITWRYFKAYLPQKGEILEIGAATGKYTLELARRGYEIIAADLSENLLEINKQRAIENDLIKKIKYVNLDARDLNKFRENSFDSILIMGPLYHLVLEEERKTVLKQALNLLKPGGKVFSSFISRHGIFGTLMKKFPQWIEKQLEVRSVLEYGRDPVDAPKGGFRGYYATIPEIKLLHEEVGFKKLVLAGVEPGISDDDDSYNNLDGTSRELWLDLLYEVSTNPTTIAASRHLLYIGEKPN